MIQFSYTFYHCGAHDIMSCPAHYFDVGESPSHVDFRDYKSGDVIFGGGGLIADGMDGAFQSAAAQPGIIKMFWGAGIDSQMIQYPEWLKEFSLVGLRDYGNLYEYVPCPSCMHQIFDDGLKKQNTSAGIVAIDHFKNRLPMMPDEVDTFIPYPEWGSFHRLINTISSARVVVTRSYHACYYSMLLGKPVVCVNPWSVKFKTFKYTPLFCDATNWKTAIIEAYPSPAGFLDECRTINQMFAEKVKKHINEHRAAKPNS